MIEELIKLTPENSNEDYLDDEATQIERCLTLMSDLHDEFYSNNEILTIFNKKYLDDEISLDIFNDIYKEIGCSLQDLLLKLSKE